MATGRSRRMSGGLGVSAAVALTALYAGRYAEIPSGSFVPSSFVVHSVMLGLSLAIIWLSGRRFSDFGFTRGTYKFRPAILLWAVPTGVLSVLAAFTPGRGEPGAVLGGMTELQLALFVWIYASICEEVLTRGLLQTLISNHSGGEPTPARFSAPIAVSGLFFGAMHLVLIESMGLSAVVPIALATLLGFIAAYYREITGSLIPAIIVHALFNIGGMLPGWIIRWLA